MSTPNILFSTSNLNFQDLVQDTISHSLSFFVSTETFPVSYKFIIPENCEIYHSSLGWTSTEMILEDIQNPENFQIRIKDLSSLGEFSTTIELRYLPNNALTDTLDIHANIIDVRTMRKRLIKYKSIDLNYENKNLDRINVYFKKTTDIEWIPIVLNYEVTGEVDFSFLEEDIQYLEGEIDLKIETVEGDLVDFMSRTILP